MKLGKTITPSPQTDIIIEENRVKGPTWSVEKGANGYVFEFISGAVTGALTQHSVTEEDFKAVQAGKLTDLDLMKKYGLS